MTYRVWPARSWPTPLLTLWNRACWRNNWHSIANNLGPADRVSDCIGETIEGGMKTATATTRFWNRRPSMAALETAWPTVRLGAIGEAWRLYRRHWGVWSLTMLASIVGVAIGEGIGTVLLRA